jgi:hypothetical protein
LTISKEEELKNIQKEIVKVNILGSTGPILLGLGIYGKFGANGDAFIEILNNINVVYSFIIGGVFIMIWVFAVVLPLLKRKSKILNENNT